LPTVSSQVSSPEVSFSPLASFFWSFFSSLDSLFQDTQGFSRTSRGFKGIEKNFWKTVWCRRDIFDAAMVIYCIQKAAFSIGSSSYVISIVFHVMEYIIEYLITQ
jgi:hypothetical protein